MPSPAEYSRYSHSHELEKFFGQRAVVYSVALVDHPSSGVESPIKAPAGFEDLAPYNMVIAEFPDGSRRTFMGVYGERFKIGDEVECVVGVNPTTAEGILPYKIKVRHPIVRLSPKQ